MYKIAEEKLASVKLAAFVDELVKCAAESGSPLGLDPFVEMLTAEHEMLLKQAGLGDWLGAAKGAISGMGQKAMGAVQNMGAGGAARRMAAAGAQHDALKPLMNSAYKSAPTGSVNIVAKTKPSDLSYGFASNAAKRQAYNPTQVDLGLSHQAIPQPQYAKATGPVRYNPQEVSNHLSLSRIPGQSSTIGAIPGAKPTIPAIQSAMPVPRQPAPIFGTSLYPQAG